MVLQCINGVGSNPVEKLHRKEEKISEILEEERQVELYAGLVFF
jgi:hypothetical protein